MTYTREQILSMPVGVELDAITTKIVMGWDNPWKPFFPSTDISAAWSVVEKMRATHIYELADFGRNKHKVCQHYAAFHPINKPRDYERQVHAKTALEAICKAAILALMESGGTGE